MWQGKVLRDVLHVLLGSNFVSNFRSLKPKNIKPTTPFFLNLGFSSYGYRRYGIDNIILNR